MCNQSAAELIARLKRAYPAYTPSEGDNTCTGIPKAGSRFQHRHKGHMVTVITATEKDVSYRKACGAVGWVRGAGHLQITHRPLLLARLRRKIQSFASGSHKALPWPLSRRSKQLMVQLRILRVSLVTSCMRTIRTCLMLMAYRRTQ